MGSKHALLQNGLGDLILAETRESKRFVDLFCGSASVSWFAAENTTLPVFSTDLQLYAVVLARSVVGRIEAIELTGFSQKWLALAQQILLHREIPDLDPRRSVTAPDFEKFVENARILCASIDGVGPIWRSYGGHYFSPRQAAMIDAMIRSLPREEPARTACLAATIASASQCAASPGHTAQPFQPTVGALKFILESWSKNPLSIAEGFLHRLCSRKANVLGHAEVGDAVGLAASLSPTDLVFVDPPYSGVQYSRFYHVLETVARGVAPKVKGVGRYPPLTSRPQSAFSNKGQSLEALRSLLRNLSESGATVIFTFPAGVASNGLSGSVVTKEARDLFEVKEQRVVSRFSTLGGNNRNRSARERSEELILVMRSR